MNSKISFLLCVLTCHCVLASEEIDKLIRCPLVWVEMNSGQLPESIPGNAIGNFDSTVFVGRVVTEDADVNVAQVLAIKEPEEPEWRSESNDPALRAYAASERYGESKMFINFEVLTNPFRCDVEWVSYFDEKVSRFGDYEGLRIGHRDRVMIFGEVKGNRLYIPNEDGIDITDNFLVLTTYLKGVDVRVSDIILDTDPSEAGADLGFMGQDTIINDADVELVCSVTYTKMVAQGFSFTESSSTSHSVEVSSGFGFHVPLVDIGVQHMRGSGSSHTNSTTVGNSTERMVQVEREVVVPPYTTLQVCSTITSNDNFTTEFTAKSMFSSPGLSCTEVKAFLEKNDVEGPFSYEGDIVVKKIKGTISLTLAMETQFIVAPLDSPRGCSSVQDKIAEEKNKKIREKIKALKSMRAEKK